MASVWYSICTYSWAIFSCIVLAVSSTAKAACSSLTRFSFTWLWFWLPFHTVHWPLTL